MKHTLSRLFLVAILAAAATFAAEMKLTMTMGDREMEMTAKKE